MRRLAAISASTAGAQAIFMGQTHVLAGTSSGPHHHGESETCIYVVSGRPRFLFKKDGREQAIETGPGDYVYIPPFEPHVEERVARQKLLHFEMRDRLAGLVGVERVPERVAAVTPDRRLDPATA